MTAEAETPEEPAAPAAGPAPLLPQDPVVEQAHRVNRARGRRRYDDDNLTLDAHEDDWGWRRRLRSNPHTHRLYRTTVGVVGAVVVVAGLIMVPFPGPGWFVVFIGVAIWASEFEWAQRLLQFGKRTLWAWQVWARRQPWYFQVVLLLVTFLAAVAVVWGLLWLLGVPRIVPGPVRGWLATYAHLG